MLVALAALLLSSLPAGAQTSVTLVSNTGQNNPVDVALPSTDLAQSFTTGNNPSGYKLTEAKVKLDVGPTYSLPSMTASICAATSASTPAVSNPCSALTITTATLVDGVNTIATGSLDLSANTTCFLVLDVVSGGSNTEIGLTDSHAEDAGAAAGWSIGGSMYWRIWANSQWTHQNPNNFRVLQIALGGYEKPPAPAAAPNPDPSNLARGAVQWDPVGAMHGLPTRQGEISSNKPSEPTGSVDLTNIAASVSEEREPHSRGFYMTTQVFGLGERSHLVRAGPNGARYIVDKDGQRYEVVSPGSLLLVKIWHVHYRPDRGTNSVELLGDTFLPRLDNRLTEPVEVCVPAPARDAERVRIAVKGRLDPHWTILDAELHDGQVCAETVRVAWLTLVYAPEPAAA